MSVGARADSLPRSLEFECAVAAVVSTKYLCIALCVEIVEYVVSSNMHRRGTMSLPRLYSFSPIVVGFTIP